MGALVQWATKVMTPVPLCLFEAGVMTFVAHCTTFLYSNTFCWSVISTTE